MKVNNEFVLREIAGDYIIIPTGEMALNFNGMITMNEVGVFLWQKLQEEVTFDELLKAVLDEYEVEEETARADIEEFIEKLENSGILK